MEQFCFSCGAAQAGRAAPVLNFPMGAVVLWLCDGCASDRDARHQQTARQRDALAVVTGDQAARILNGKP